MQRTGKLENIKEEMKKTSTNIMGLGEVRWTGEGDFNSDGYRIIYSGGAKKENGVAIMVEEKVVKSVEKVRHEGDRLIMVRLKAIPVNMVIIQLYMPTSGHTEEEIEDMYQRLEDLIQEETKGTDFVVIMGDWNAVVGEGTEGKEVGDYGLGKRNARGQRLVDFCKENKYVITNTWFKQEKRRRYTWKQPGDRNRYQLDYILVKQRFRNSVLNSKTYPGADANTDHSLVAARIRSKLKIVYKGKNKKHWNTESLKETEKTMAFMEKLEDKIEQQEDQDEKDVERRWQQLKGKIKDTAEEVVGYKTGKRRRKPWITDEMMDTMKERRKWKNSSTQEGKKNYRRLNNELRRTTDKAKEKWWKEQCEELEELEKKGRTDLMYQKVKNLSSKKTRNTTKIIKDKQGKELTNPKEKGNLWKE